MNTGKTLFAQLMDFLPWSTPSVLPTRGGPARGGLKLFHDCLIEHFARSRPDAVVRIDHRLPERVHRRRRP